VEASTEPYDMRLQRMLGHMPALLLAKPPFGAGGGLRRGRHRRLLCVAPEVKRIVICEMERIIPPVATRFFGKENNNVLNDPRVAMVYDDARHFVLTTPREVRCDHLRPDSSVGQRQRQHFILKSTLN